jgi:hypothetical protein
MSNYNASTGPQFSKRRGGTGRRKATDDAVFGLVIGGLDLPSVPYNTLLKFIQLSDAEALGLDADYDDTNEIQVHYNIAQFFEYCPSGTLYFMLGDYTSTELKDYVDYGSGNILVQKMLREASQEIKVVGVMSNMEAGFSTTYQNDVYKDLDLSVTRAQDTVNKLRAESILVDCIVLAGMMKPGGSLAVSSYLDLRALASEDVVVTWIADPSQLAKNANYEGTSAIGATLGMMAQRKVSECLGAVNIENKPDEYQGSENYSLTRKAKSLFLDACLPTGRLYKTLTANEKALLDSLGWIYALQFQGYEGIFISESHTCTAADSDYAFAEDNRVWNKAARLVRQALIPLMRGTLEVDNATGNPSDSTMESMRRIGVNALQPMIKARELQSEVNIIFVPDPNGGSFLTTGKITLDIQYNRNGVLRQLIGTIGQ